MAARLSAPSPDSGRITVPSLNRDPLQSLQPWPLVVTVAHRDLTIPPLPASEWLSVLMSDSLELDDVFPGLLPDEEEQWVEDQLMGGSLGAGEYQRLILDVIETASARRWWITLRLVGLARSSWDVLGAEMTLRGVDASRLSLSGWLDVLMITILRNMDSKDVSSFTSRLEAPPPEEQEAVAEELEMSRDAFLAMSSQ